jgi:hypothetical protein
MDDCLQRLEIESIALDQPHAKFYFLDFVLTTFDVLSISPYYVHTTSNMFDCFTGVMEKLATSQYIVSQDQKNLATHHFS